MIDKRMEIMNYKGFCNQVNQLIHRECVVGNSLDIDGMICEEEIRKDIEIKNMQQISIWGELKDYNNQPIVGECVRLIRIYDNGDCEKLEMVESTITDELGHYSLNVYGKENEKYTVLVDYQMINPQINAISSGLVNAIKGLAGSKSKCVNDFVKFSN